MLSCSLDSAPATGAVLWGACESSLCLLPVGIHSLSKSSMDSPWNLWEKPGIDLAAEMPWHKPF